MNPANFAPARLSTSSTHSEQHSLQDLERPLMDSSAAISYNNRGNKGISHSGSAATPASPSAGAWSNVSSSSPRHTAQAAFHVTSEPSPTKQLVALGIKNVRVRSRDFAQTLNAIFQPVWMMLILVFLHLSAKDSSHHMSVKALPYLSVDTCKSTVSECIYFGYTGIPATDPMITELSSFFAASEPQSVAPKFYTDEAAMTAAYDAAPVNFVVGVVFTNPSTNLSRPSSAATPVGSQMDVYQYTILANHTAHASYDYLDTRFATAQAYVERAAINLRRKASQISTLSSPLPLKNTAPPTATTGAGRTFISYANFVGLASSINQALNAYYVIFCFQAVWVGVLSILVVEKKNKIRMAMTMMGMGRDPYLISLWIMQNIQNLVTCALMVLILFVGRIFTNTDAFIVWLLLILFSFNTTAFGSIAAVFVPDPKKTNSASFLILIFNVGCYGICSALVFSSGKVVSPITETLLYLIPSVALGRAINYITGVEAALGGVAFQNLSEGPCGKALWMLTVDCLIFYFLAWYVDAVVPNESSNALPLDFFLRPSYWGFGQVSQQQFSKGSLDLTSSLNQYHPKEHTDMFEQTDISHIPASDRGIIQVRDLYKRYSTGPGWAYSIPIWGLILRLVYPPRSSRTTGPFSGVQQQTVVSGLNLTVHRNEILGFLGHNGAGKTTSLSMIMGMVRPSSGTVMVNGHIMPGSSHERSSEDGSGQVRNKVDLRTLSEVQKQMGVCPQHDVLFDTLTAWETMRLYAAIKGVKVLGRKSNAASTEISPLHQKHLLDDYLEHLLEDVHLREKQHERVATFSGGMKRKLSVALAFLGDPKVVLLDEPTTGMDIFSKKQIWQLMQDSKPGRAILLTTHSMEEADALSDRIAILSKGELQTLGTSMFLKNRFGVGYRLSLEKRRVMLADQQQQQQKGYRDIQSTSLLAAHESPYQQYHHGASSVVLFNEDRATSIVQRHFPDAIIDVNTSTDITYVLPTTATVEERHGRTAQQYIRDKKTALPGLFQELDEAIATNQLGVVSVGLSLTTLEEVFISLQEQEADKLLKEEQEQQ